MAKFEEKAKWFRDHGYTISEDKSKIIAENVSEYHLFL